MVNLTTTYLNHVSVKTNCFSDIYLIILHEMIHVLGIGTLWPGFMCGTNCVIRNGEDASYQENVYECDNAKAEYSKIYGNISSLRISSKDCSHWSGEE